MTRTAAVAFVAMLTLGTAAFVTAEQNPTPPTAPAAAQAPPPAGRGRGAAPLVSPDVGADRRITFRFRAPGATDVAVMLGRGRILMQKDAQGVWSATTDPMNPDIYTYSLSVDGATMNDPNNRQVQTSFGSFQSLVVVPGPAAWLPAPNVPRGAITRHTYRSALAGDERNFFVYTPAGYDARRSRAYPVLYLLHGLGDDAERWMTGGGGAHNILDNLIAANTAVPMVVVTPLGYGTSMGPAGGRGASNITGYHDILLNEVMPMIDKSYHVSRNREERAIAGLSMGGAESLYVGLNNLDRFAWIGAFSSAPILWPPVLNATVAAMSAAPAPATPPAAAPGGRGAAPALGTLDPALIAQTFPNLSAKDNSRIRMLWIVCGTADSLIGHNRDFKKWLTSRNIAFTEQEVPDIGHVWPLWRQNLTDMVPRLFRRGR